MCASSFLDSTGTEIRLIRCVQFTFNFREIHAPIPKTSLTLMSLCRSKSLELIMTSCVRKDYSREKGTPNTFHLKCFTLRSMFVSFDGD